MNARHPQNKNLTLHFEPGWHGMPVNVNHGPLIVEYLEGIDRTLWDATEDHLRTLVVRLDLHFPAYQAFDSSGSITDFIRRLRAMIEADLARKGRQRKRVHRCNVRHIWVRERVDSFNYHFHVALFVNHDNYSAAGPFEGPGGLMYMARKAWSRVLGIELKDSAGLVHGCGPGIVIDVNSGNFNAKYNEALQLAKRLGDGLERQDSYRSGQVRIPVT